jgi:hypothetical protein
LSPRAGSLTEPAIPAPIGDGRRDFAGAALNRITTEIWYSNTGAVAGSVGSSPDLDGNVLPITTVTDNLTSQSQLRNVERSP